MGRIGVRAGQGQEGEKTLSAKESIPRGDGGGNAVRVDSGR